MRTIIVFFLLCSICFAQEINEKYSYKAYPYHNLSFKDKKSTEFNNTTIIGSCFYQECSEDGTPPFDIFPNITGVIFERCNLDNIYIPPGNIVKDSCNRKLKVQNDWEVWVLNDSFEPIEPMNKSERLKAGVSIDPEDIPIKKFTEEEVEQFKRSLDAEIITP